MEKERGTGSGPELLGFNKRVRLLGSNKRVEVLGFNKRVAVFFSLSELGVG